MKTTRRPPGLNSSCLPDLSPRKLKRLMSVAAGREPADRLIRGVRLLNVHTPAVEDGVSLALAAERVAAVGPNLDHLAGERTEVIDGRDRLVLPGMIDAHTHLDSIFTVREFARLALISGNTTVMTETAMIANAAGPEGVDGFMAEASNIPLRVFFLAPPLIPPFPNLETSAGFDFPAFRTMLKRPDVIGVGETYWRPALDLEPRTLKRFALARALGKSLEGHAAGARGANLQAYRAGGVSACHEPIAPEEVFERLALGMAVQIRDGYIRRDLPAMGPVAAKRDLDTRRLILATDLAAPEMLLKTGVMNELVRRAVAVGFDPLRAVQMVTLNPADHFGLRDLGRINPGALADLVLVDDLKGMNVETVMVGGNVVAHRGMLTVDIPDFEYPQALYDSFRLKRVQATDFALVAPSGPVRVRAVAAASETVTREEIVEVTAVRNRISADPQRDLVKAAVFDKHSMEPRGAVGLAKGMGLKAGAAATSLLWDTNNILCVGVTDKEMALAVNRLLHNRGGMVVVRGDRVLAEMPLPIGGVISQKSFPDLMREGAAVEKAVHDLGCTLARPFLVFQTFCFTGLPFLRLTDKGLVDVRRGALVKIVL